MRLGDVPVGRWVLLPRKRTPERVFAQSQAKTYLKRYKVRAEYIRCYHADEPVHTHVRLTDEPEWIHELKAHLR
jgi:hypothetical protein